MKIPCLCIVIVSIFAPTVWAQDEDQATENKKAEEAAKKKHEETVAKYSGKAVLPNWAPKVPEFKPSGPATVKTIDGQEKFVVTGTSPAAPKAIADAWDAFKNDKYSHERTDSDIGGHITQTVTYSKMENPMESVRMEAERKQGAKITQVTVSSPIVETEDGDAEEHMEEEMKPPPRTSEGNPPIAMYINLPAGAASGRLVFNGSKADLKFAYAFVDQKDERKPTILLITDQSLPAEKWKSESDMMADKTKWNGLAAFMDDEGSIFRTDVHMNGRQTSVSGVFNIRMLDTKVKDLTGTATTSEDEKENQMDVRFHAAAK